MNLKELKKTDPAIYKLLKLEEERQLDELELIPSENYASAAVMEALGTVLTNKYSEGYPGHRYYAGNKFVDEVELIAKDRVTKLFGVPFANVQPYSGSPANQAVYAAVLNPGDTVMGMHLHSGGHLTHGWRVNFSGLTYKSIQYHVKEDGIVDFAEVERLVKEHKPKLIWVGATAYTKQIEFEVFAQIAHTSDAYVAADISHIAGLIVGGAHPSPVPFVHIVTSTTHKTLRGARGAVIMVTKKGIQKDPELPDKIDKAVFPGIQGGPHNNVTAANAVAFKEASTDKFKKYAKQVVKNAKALGRALKREEVDLVGGGTENHLLLIDLTKTNSPGSGIFVHEALELAGIVVNKNTIPNEPFSAYYPSGIRLGTPAITTRGMIEKDMEKIASWIKLVIKEVSKYSLSQDKEQRLKALKQFRADIKKNKLLLQIKSDVKKLCRKYPVPGIN